MMSWQAGLPHTAPDIEIPEPPMTLNTTNNNHVASGSQVGQINAGAIIFLNQAVSGLSKIGQAELASLLQSFTQQVADSKELTLQSQQEVLDMLRAVPVCPVSAIFALDDLPEKWKEYTALNESYVKAGKFTPEEFAKHQTRSRAKSRVRRGAGGNHEGPAPSAESKTEGY